jgi:enterobactin synthetase component F
VRAYNIGEYTKIFGTIDPKLFESALRHVVIETEALRVRFDERDSVPRQLIAASPDWGMTYQDVGSEVDPISVAEAWMRTDMARPLDLHTGPFFAFALFKTGPEEFLWYVRYHHLVMDAFGASLITSRVADVYSAFAAGSNVECKPLGSLVALIEEDAAYRASRHFETDRQFFMNSMLDCPEPQRLGSRMSSESLQVLRETVYLASADALQFQHFGQRMELSPTQVIALVTAIFIHRLTGAEDIVLGLFMTARMSPTAKRTPAMVTNVLPLRVNIQPGMSVRDLALQVRRAARAIIRHQRYRIADLRRDLRRIDRPLIEQSVSVRPFACEPRFAGLHSTTFPLSNGPTDDLNIHVVYDQVEHGAWRVEFDANPARYDRASLQLLRRRFLQLLAVMDDPDEIVGRLEVLPPDERRQILCTWNQTKSDYPSDRHVHELFEEQTQRTPGRVAVTYEQQRLTYRELNERADRIAHHLSLAGVGPDDRVGLYVERSLEMVVGLLGILKAGGAYVPLDPNYPQDRVTFILDDCQPAVLLTQESLHHRLRLPNTKILCVDALPILRADVERMRSTKNRQTSDLAYVLYTSGSTGQPKGVQITHRSLVNFLKAMEHEPGITIADRLLSVTSLSFDISGLELLLPLIVGAQVTIASREVAADGFRLAALMQECGATLMQATPATWRLLLEAGWRGSESLKILCGGEAWPSEMAAALLPRCASLWNMYGPTETTVWSSVARIQGAQKVLIGPPIANTKFYVLDVYGQPVPVGVPGELYIGGDGVARGYLNRPELTRERFVTDPFSGEREARMYRTGDRVRYLPNGHLEFLGRLDQQVKIRGYRVELGEIEAILRLHPQVEDAVVVARNAGEGETQLVAYVTAGDTQSVPVGGLRDLLRQKLAPYMMPAAIIPLDAFRLTPNGKIDREALPLADDRMRQAANESFPVPSTPLEQLLAGFWCDCLGLKQVGIHDNFFDLGGDSLAMLRLSLEIERATGQSFPLTWVYDAPTVAGMAEILGGHKSGSSYSPLVLLRPGTNAPPVFMVHPVGGNTMQLIPIAKAFPGDRAVYGVQARGFDGTDAPMDSVEAMAECYARAIIEEQPHGPYLLAGMCFGGLVAMEVARRLSEREERIGLLALLDTYPHPRCWPLRFRTNYFIIQRIVESWAALRTLGRQEAVSYIKTRIRALVGRFATLANGTHSFIRAPDSLPPVIKAVFDGGIAALANYRPRYYPGKVSYLMCGYHAYLPNGPGSVWARLVGQLEVMSAPVAMQPDYVADWLFDRIEDVVGQDMRSDDAPLEYQQSEPVSG